MRAETAQRFEALETLASNMRALFTKAGYEPVSPAILQPADILLDCSGEALRARTYVFTDLDGTELCLRPDITVPTARLYMERHPTVFEEARYCYNGPTFRYSPASSARKNKGKTVRPREFRQMGLELYAMRDRLAAEAEIFKLTLDGVEQAGLSDYRIKIGDLGLFGAFLDAIDMPDRWRVRLKHHFWRPELFHKLLHELAWSSENKSSENKSSENNGEPQKNTPHLDPKDPISAMLVVSRYMSKNNIPLFGNRTLEEITLRLLEQQLDSDQQRLSGDHVQLIEDYLDINGPPRAAVARINDLTDKAGISIDKALRNFEKRLDLFKARGIDLKSTEFSAEFGRDFEYYTGFVFQVEAPDSAQIGPIAGGGRYDKLLQKLGASEKVKAIGCAIHTERLLTVVEGEME